MITQRADQDQPNIAKINFNLGNGRDVRDIARCASLTPEEESHIDHIGLGEANTALKGRLDRPIFVRLSTSADLFRSANHRRGASLI